jgi:hypothetical protein
MTWTKERPQKNGFYWMLWRGDREPTIARVVGPHVRGWDGEAYLFFNITPSLLSQLESEGVSWFGPIEPPEIPKD